MEGDSESLFPRDSHKQKRGLQQALAYHSWEVLGVGKVVSGSDSSPVPRAWLTSQLCLWLAVSASSWGCPDQAEETCSPLPPSWSSAGPCPAPKCSSGVSPSLLRWQEKKWPQAQFLEPRAWALSQGQLELRREAGAGPTGSTGGTGSVGISEKREQRLLQGAGSCGGLNSHPAPSVQPRGRMETGTGHSQLIPRESPYK